ncbi:MAG: hypothetical protein U9N61_00025 [Euryarchaeota archaeon]|nr:hypothetical protein [Euryarchaeota archaeon]
MKCVKCLRCQKPMRIEEDERDCIFCGYPLEHNSKKITEKEWREYWGRGGVLGQPYHYNKVKMSKETHIDNH